VTTFRWPWVSRAELARVEAEANALNDKLIEMTLQRDYWRSKAEKLLDSALMRRGETAEPVFSPSPTPSVERTMGSIFGPLAVTEIESGKRRPHVSEDAPHTRR
jgi:hypothetical protein